MTPEGLVDAVRKLLTLNKYAVEGPFKIHGAEVDLCAQLMGDPFAPKLYIEATVEYVNNDKYGKDMGKLALIREKEPDAQLLIVSSEGFALPVKERASQTRIRTLTYDELFHSFERFESYVRAVAKDGDLCHELRSLNEIYEEPHFRDTKGNHLATEWLDQWRTTGDKSGRWLVVVGEYGTGKTALTKVLQYRWVEKYLEDPSLPIPFRIHLRDFTRQFDARGLLHHFLDHNGLGHLSIDFVLSLIRAGRVILVLDGYDEMAQHLSARERRACLEALSELAEGGTKGVLTSRPNYFTESEELQVFETLYSSLDQRKYYLGPQERQVLEQERRVDALLEQFIEPNERRLVDLTPEQTSALVERVLADDVEGRAVVLSVLARAFREESGEARSLGGKPVIVSYLVSVVEELKSSGSASSISKKLTEWQVYKIIVDQLMLRDFRRAPDILPEQRRKFLQLLSEALSRRQAIAADEAQMKDLVREVFARDLQRSAGEAKVEHLERLFADMRSSTTLTRDEVARQAGWRFSHNSLKEFLLAELLVDRLMTNASLADRPVITDAMRAFVTSRESDESALAYDRLKQRWVNRFAERGVGALLSLHWDAALALHSGEESPRGSAIRALTGTPAALNDVELERIQLSDASDPVELRNATFANSALLTVGLLGADLAGANFEGCVLDGTDLTYANLEGARFPGAELWEVGLIGAKVRGADFSQVSLKDLSIVVEMHGKFAGRQRLEGDAALAYLNHEGALTPPVSKSMLCAFHQNFPIVEKVLRNLAVQKMRQRRGLEQRGAAQQDHVFARDLVAELERHGLVYTPGGRGEQIGATEEGRRIFDEFTTRGVLPDEIADFILRSG